MSDGIKIVKHHPDTGRRYLYLFPVSPVFDELRASYSKLAETRPWIEVIGPGDEHRIVDDIDPDQLFICFHRPRKDTLSRPRAGKVAFVYCEPLGPIAGMTSDGLNYLQSFRDILGLIDGILCHTPAMCDEMATVTSTVPIGLLPAGLDMTAMVTPDWTTPKDIDFLFYGSMAGKRLWSIPLLKEKLGDRLHIAPNVYGRELGALLNRSKVSVYVAHSDVNSFSTWRAWQTSFTSAVMAIECLDGKRADAWPFEPYSQYTPLPTLQQDGSTTEEYVERLFGMVSIPSIDRVAWQWARTAAHTNYWLATEKFSAERCVEDYLLKTGEAIFKETK